MTATLKPTTEDKHEGTPDDLSRLRLHLGKQLLGKASEIDLVIACVLSRGHLLLDDLPGTGKTTLAKAFASALGGKLARVQCTPDLMPSDVTGFSIFNQKSREFEFHPGPVFADILLADELNRTTPRTQSALLEAMAEGQVTIDGDARPLSSTFFVIATQNPIDSHGAYPLPEAQLDRFSIKLRIGYPDRTAQREILRREVWAEDQAETSISGDQNAVMSLGRLQQLQFECRRVAVHDKVAEYLLDLVEATREDASITLGVSPRGMMAWQAMAQGWALLQGRSFVTPTDIDDVAPAVLSVRLLVRGGSVEDVISRVLSEVPTPQYK
ncbi:MAG: MoxR family ATPase [Planctomycetota bacterium]